jgi:tetratricopeptide (TPR) repeat protein
MGKYDLALEEVQEGLALTEDTDLYETMDMVNSYIQKQEYDIMVADAAEYIYQENYEDGIKKYKEAIVLIPEEEQAYIGLAQAYLSQEEYEMAADLLQTALEKIKVYSKELEGLYDQAAEYVAAIKERKQMLTSLYNAMLQPDVKRLLETMNSEVFINNIAVDAPVYFGPLGEGDMVKNYGMVIYDNKNIYLGDMKDRIKYGTGTYFMITPQYGSQSYYYYQGEWMKDNPNGSGKTVEVTETINAEGEKHSNKVETQGIFYNGLENGSMSKKIYTDDQEIVSIKYSAHNGIPVPAVDENGQPLPVKEGESYAIGSIYHEGEPTGEYYYVESVTNWGVKPFMK